MNEYSCRFFARIASISFHDDAIDDFEFLSHEWYMRERMTEKLLVAAGGWKETQEAKRLVEVGNISDVEWQGDLMLGFAREGSRVYRCGLKWISEKEVENLCKCPRSSHHGIVCAHSLAVGIAWLRQQSGEMTQKTAGNRPVSSSDTRPTKDMGASSASSLTENFWDWLLEEPEEGAAELELSVILPPNLEAALEKQRLNVVFEAKIDNQPRLFSAVDPKKRYVLPPEDWMLTQALYALFGGEVPGMVMMTSEQLPQLWAGMAGHPRVTLGKKTPVPIGDPPIRPQISLNERQRVVAELPQKGLMVCPIAGAWQFHEGAIRPVTPGLPGELMAIFADGLPITSTSNPQFLQQLEHFFSVPQDFFDNLPKARDPQIHLDMEGSLRILEARLQFNYGQSVPFLVDSLPDPGTRVLKDSEGNNFLTSEAVETHTIQEILQAGFSFSRSTGKFTLKEEAQILHFYAFIYPKWIEKWKITTGERFDHAKTKIIPIEPELEVHHAGNANSFSNSGENWFQVDLKYSTAGGTPVPAQDIQHLLRGSKPYRTAPDGKITVLDVSQIQNLQESLRDCEPTQIAPEKYQIQSHYAEFLAHQGKPASEWVQSLLQPIHHEKQQVRQMADSQLGELKNVLRPYQLEGVYWLLDLYHRKLGGILADDMGLGKTLQTISLIQATQSEALIVCPSSLTQNWADEFRKFAPEIPVSVITGTGKNRLEKLARSAASGQVLITSYALLRQDSDHYFSKSFPLVILDEAHSIKNPDAQITKILYRLQGDRKFALTGTPVENSPQDLWSLFQFIMPGYLGSAKSFQERFTKPISSGDPHSTQQLHRKTRPFLLRRLKSDVAKDLPEKIEQVVWCDFTEEQEKNYRAILAAGRDKIAETKGNQKRMVALTVLLRLRQVCCDLRLLGLDGADSKAFSGKLEVLWELLEEAGESEHKILLFSQFSSMLTLLAASFQEKNIPYCYLDGQTRNRQEQIQKFQNSPEIPVFLISLKAGGVGLNLTSADTVIHFDPWWNPAVEDQATDRAHRIGQSRVVTSYKLLHRNSVEEKILHLQTRKRAQSAALVGTTSVTPTASLSFDEIQELLQ